MPVRFLCPECHQLLAVGSKKIGKEVNCPKCQAAIVVPDPEQDETATGAELAAALAGRFEGDDVQEAITGLQVFEQVPAVQPTPVVDRPKPLPADDETPAASPALVLIPRVILYWQAGLIGVVALVAFGLGWWIGGAGRNRPANEPAARPEAPAEVSVKLQYDQGGRTQADAGAVVILLPAGKVPDDKIDVDGLHPAAPPPSDDHPGKRAIEAIGGAYGRTNERGELADLVVPTGGRYHVLLISSRAQRPPEVQPKPADLAMLGRFFALAPDLIGEQRYRWSTEEIVGKATITHTFVDGGL
jgi:hypothetical protein